MTDIIVSREISRGRLAVGGDDVDVEAMVEDCGEGVRRVECS